MSKHIAQGHAAITLGRDGGGDTVFRLWLHLVLGESDTVDSRHAVLLSALFSIYRCFRALSCMHACLPQNMKLLVLPLWCGKHSRMQMQRPCLCFCFAINWFCIFFIVITLQIFLSQEMITDSWHNYRITYSLLPSNMIFWKGTLFYYLSVPLLSTEWALKETPVEENNISSPGLCASRIVGLEFISCKSFYYSLTRM